MDNQEEPDNEKEDLSDTINAVGIWIIRLALVGTAIYFFAKNKQTEAEGTVSLLILTLFLF
jgi:hypothetical protein